MFMDSSSELVHSLLPVFMVSVLGASMMTVGVIEGIAEATASVTKVFSGVLSDYFRKRKFLVVLGYGLSAVTKLVFPLATALGWVLAARFVDRVGKGIRGAPRDAMITDLVQPEMRGAAFGLRQSLDSVGAFIGPLLAVGFMLWFANDIKAVMWVAVVPAFIAVGLLFVAVREPPAKESGLPSRLTLADVKRLSGRYWLIVILACAFTMARFSEAFLVLRAQDAGIPLGLIPTIMITMNVVYAMIAWPAGAVADRIHPRTLLLTGLAVLILADAILAAATSSVLVFVGAGLWGLHMALTQGLLSKLVADAAPEELRGTAFGLFHLASGLAMLMASIIAGSLWNVFGPSATFSAGAAFAVIAAVGLLLYRPTPIRR
jgi:MFS family permease